MSNRGMRALALALLLVGAAFTALGANIAASPSDNQPEPSVIGPRLDEVVVSEQLDRSLALTQMIAGQQDSMWFDVSGAVDQDRALAADTLDRFPAYGLFDEFTMNPAIQSTGPDNPFAIRAVREGMQFLIDRDFVVRDIYGGRAVAYKTTSHPRSPDYGRNIATFLQLEDKYAFNPEKGKTQIFTALQAAGWTIGTDGFWHDPSGDLFVWKLLRRTQDQRLHLGGYYEQIAKGLNFNVLVIGVLNAAIPYGSARDQNIWHTYTAGWISTSLTAWDDGQLHFFSACGIGQPFCGADTGFYEPPAELLDIAETLAFGLYKSLDERATLIARGTELAMAEALQVFVDARQSIWVNNNRMDGLINDLFGGNTNPWSLKAATVPAVGGVRQAKMMNLVMFVDGWNPFVSPGWLYDGVQRDLMTDPAMAPHPHTGRYVNYRTNATVDTSGPDGNATVPSNAAKFDAATNTWVNVAAGTTAVSKVTYDFMFGSWHHGQAISMDDVMNAWACLTRRSDEVNGDIATTPGITNAATEAEKFFVENNWIANRVVDSDTLEVYMDYWHADLQEIAAFGSFFPSAPWEVCELAAKTLMDGETVYNDGDLATTTNTVWLDLTKGDSIAILNADFATLQAANQIPPGMATYPGGSITAQEATDRWAALGAFKALRGHYWPSNGPFYLAVVDTVNRQSTFRADRTGYPVPQNYWDALTIVGIPSVNFAPTPPVVFAGTPAIFDFSVSVGPAPTDAFDSTWFLRDASTGEFISEGAPSRLGTGSYRVEIPSTQTETLLLGNFEIITVVTGHAAAVPTVRRSPFLILPSTAWFEALLDARATLLEGDITDLSGDIGTVQSDLTALSASTSGLLGLVTAMAILAVVAVVVAVVSVVLVMRRGRAPPMMKSESGGEGSGQM